MNYTNIPSAIRPLPHSNELPIPIPPESYSIDSDDEPKSSTSDDIPGPSTSHDPDFVIQSPSQSHKMTQNELNDLVRDLELLKSKSELLASRLKQYNYLANNVKVSVYRTCQKLLEQFFEKNNKIVFCNDVHGLMVAVNIQPIPEQWRLFLDSSKLSLKAVLLHNGNTLPSIPVGYAIHMKETYENMKDMLNCINYDRYKWQVCGDLKMVAILLGLQLGYTKYCCFLCEWDSRATTLHYKRKDWPLRQALEPGTKNILQQPLIESSKILLPPLHIKLGLIKNFVKALDRDGPAFRHLISKFPRLSIAKIKEGIFIGPQIRELFSDEHFAGLLTKKEHAAWESFRAVALNFLGNHRAQNYRQIVDNMLTTYSEMGCNMSLKIHFLHSHLDFFPKTVVQFLMNMESVFTKQFQRLKEDTRVHGVLQCLLSIAGQW